MEIRLEDRFQDDFQCHLYETILNRGNTQWSEFARLSRFGDKPLADRLRGVCTRPQFPADFRQKFLYSTGTILDLAAGESINAWGSDTAVAAQLSPGK